eukprot:CAMPEP_0167787618 /NCGR_PEP_ID=MMETSP0111_2-20121227/9542_1 /TAXON_ID=91324 /ORGANISM="Lotharella globosa, Strain CCCM811" /LENGTH=389 /DNA_ID=CAMNT_0007679319 /DNA_START=83 /DNA_END=1252 /DNA_ORIENTATION=+
MLKVLAAVSVATAVWTGKKTHKKSLVPDSPDGWTGKAVVHIGPPKTGTTYLQETMCNMEELLKSKNIAIPTAEGVCDPGAFFDMGHELRSYGEVSGHPIEDLKTGLARTQKAKQGVFISTESLFMASLNQTMQFKSILAEYGYDDVTIVSFHRSDFDWFRSKFSQRTKHDVAAVDPLNDIMRYAGDHDYVSLVKPYMEAFGTDNVHIVSYDNVLAQGKDLSVVLYTTFLGLSEEDIQRHVPQVDVNVSPDVNDIALWAFVQNVMEIKEGTWPELPQYYLGHDGEDDPACLAEQAKMLKSKLGDAWKCASTAAVTAKLFHYTHEKLIESGVHMYHYADEKPLEISVDAEETPADEKESLCYVDRAELHKVDGYVGEVAQFVKATQTTCRL